MPLRSPNSTRLIRTWPVMRARHLAIATLWRHGVNVQEISHALNGVDIRVIYYHIHERCKCQELAEW